MTAATFLGVDASHQGTWKGAFGQDGAMLHGDILHAPSYANVLFHDALNYTWADPVADVQALQKGASDDRVASVWYADTLQVDVEVTDGAPHRVSLYLLDWDVQGRRTSIQALDEFDAPLGAPVLAESYQAGQYFQWDVHGHVKFRLTGVMGNAVVAGVFFDPTIGTPEQPTLLSVPLDYIEGIILSGIWMEASGLAYVTPSVVQFRRKGLGGLLMARVTSISAVMRAGWQ